MHAQHNQTTPLIPEDPVWSAYVRLKRILDSETSRWLQRQKRMASDPFVTTRGRNEARRRSSGDSGVDSSGVLMIAAAHESVLSVLHGATTNPIVNLVPVCSSSSLPET